MRFRDRVRESNTITNLDTGETLQEGPDSFLQRVLVNDRDDRGQWPVRPGH